MKTIQVREGLELRPLTVEHAEALFKTIDQNRNSLRTWLPFVDFTETEEDSRLFIISVSDSENERVYSIFYHDSFAGLAGFREIDYTNARAEIGYWLSPVYQGQGIMTACVEKLMEYAFTRLKFNRLQLRIAVKNERSLRIAQRFGFTLEGVERDGELLSSGYTDMKVFSLLKKETVWK